MSSVLIVTTNGSKSFGKCTLGALIAPLLDGYEQTYVSPKLALQCDLTQYRLVIANGGEMNGSSGALSQRGAQFGSKVFLEKFSDTPSRALQDYLRACRGVDFGAEEQSVPPGTAIEIVQVPFHGDMLEAVKRDDGIWVGVKRACENVGLDVEGQRKKLQDAAWARTDMISVRDSAGRTQPTFMLHLSKVPMWLATITASKVDPAIRHKLERYQNEAATVLAAYFTPAAAHAAGVDVEAIGQAISETGRQLKAHDVSIRQLAAQQEIDRKAAEARDREIAKRQEDLTRAVRFPEARVRDDTGQCIIPSKIGMHARTIKRGLKMAVMPHTLQLAEHHAAEQMAVSSGALGATIRLSVYAAIRDAASQALGLNLLEGRLEDQPLSAKDYMIAAIPAAVAAAVASVRESLDRGINPVCPSNMAKYPKK